MLVTIVSGQAPCSPASPTPAPRCSSSPPLPASAGGCEGKGGFFVHLAGVKAEEVETHGSPKAKVFELEEDCSLVNTDPTCGLSGRQVALRHEGFGGRSL